MLRENIKKNESTWDPKHRFEERLLFCEPGQHGTSIFLKILRGGGSDLRYLIQSWRFSLGIRSALLRTRTFLKIFFGGEGGGSDLRYLIQSWRFSLGMRSALLRTRTRRFPPPASTACSTSRHLHCIVLVSFIRACAPVRCAHPFFRLKNTQNRALFKSFIKLVLKC